MAKKRIEIKLPTIEKIEGKTKISFTQYSMFRRCPKRWELMYKKRLIKSKPNIYTVFGNAVHSVIQEWSSILFNETIKKSNEYDYEQTLKHYIKKYYTEAVESLGEHFSTKEELAEFYSDAVSILKYFKLKRKNYFTVKKEHLIGHEVYVTTPIVENYDVYFEGYIDTVIFNEINNTYLIKDYKTSTRGWGDYEKRDEIKRSQVLLYKYIFSKIFKIPIDMIVAEFLILKRKINPDALYPQSRIQRFEPPQASRTVQLVVKEVEEFIKSAFNADGSFNDNFEFVAFAGPGCSNCKFCEFVDDNENCPFEKRLR